MGSRKQETFIRINVSKDSSVNFQLVALNGDDMSTLEKLEDFVMS